MKHRDPDHHSAKNLIKYTVAADGTYTPDLNLVNVFRVSSPLYNLIVGTPKNPRDGQYLRLEVVSANAKTINFSTSYHVNGAVIADAAHDANALLILHGYYNADTSVWNMIVLGVLAA